MRNFDEFETVIRQKAGVVIASVPRLGIYVRAADIASALDAVSNKKRELLDDIAAGLVDEDFVLRPAANLERSPGLIVYTVKAGVAVALLSLGLIVSFEFLSTRLDSTIEKAKTALDGALEKDVSLDGGRMWNGVVKALHRAAQPGKDVPEEEKKQVVEDLRTISDRWRPFVNDAVTALSSGAPTTEPAR